jgi:hypothetical protein
MRCGSRFFLERYFDHLGIGGTLDGKLPLLGRSRLVFGQSMRVDGSRDVGVRMAEPFRDGGQRNAGTEQLRAVRVPESV